MLVNVGGDLAAAGPLPPAGWPVRLTDDTAREDVDNARPAYRSGVRMHGGGLATSSTAVRRWRRGGEAYHHVLDPRTGLPAEPVWRTVTVAAASCVDANTASTAAIVRGPGRPATGWPRSGCRLVWSTRPAPCTGSPAGPRTREDAA